MIEMMMMMMVLYEERGSEFSKLEKRRDILLRILPTGTLVQPWNQC